MLEAFKKNMEKVPRQLMEKVSQAEHCKELLFILKWKEFKEIF